MLSTYVDTRKYRFRGLEEARNGKTAIAQEENILELCRNAHCGSFCLSTSVSSELLASIAENMLTTSQHTQFTFLLPGFQSIFPLESVVWIQAH